MDEKIDKLGQLIDRLDNIASGLSTSGLSAESHMDVLRIVLPDEVKRLKAAFADVFGYNPWE